MVHQTAVAHYDGDDGVKDGLISDPLSCHFDAKTLLCKKGDAPDCLTAPQLEAYDKILRGARNRRTGAQIYPPWPLGVALTGPTVRYNNHDDWAPIVFRSLLQDANWDYRTEDFDKDVARSDKLADHLINAVEPAGLQALFKRGRYALIRRSQNTPAPATATTPETSPAVCRQSPIPRRRRSQIHRSNTVP